MPIELPNVTTTHPEDQLTAEERVGLLEAAVAAGRGHHLTPEQVLELYSSIPVPPPIERPTPSQVSPNIPRIIDDIIRHRDEQLAQATNNSTLHGPTFNYEDDLPPIRDFDPSEYTRTQRTRRRPNVRAPSALTRDKSTKKCKHTGGPQYNRLRFTSSLESDG